MARRGKQVSSEELGLHIVHMASVYSGRTYSDWEFEYYRRETSRIYEDWLALCGLDARPDKTAADLSDERQLLAAQRANWDTLTTLKSRPLDFLKYVIEYDEPLIFFGEDQLCSMAKRLLRARGTSKH